MSVRMEPTSTSASATGCRRPFRSASGAVGHRADPFRTCTSWDVRAHALCALQHGRFDDSEVTTKAALKHHEVIGQPRDKEMHHLPPAKHAYWALVQKRRRLLPQACAMLRGTCMQRMARKVR